jgi:hypothetical protein
VKLVFFFVINTYFLHATTSATAQIRHWASFDAWSRGVAGNFTKKKTSFTKDTKPSYIVPMVNGMPTES